MKIGYARVSTAEQNLDLQRDALEGVGCKRIYGEQASGKNTERPALTSCLKALRSGDVLVSGWKIDFPGFQSKIPIWSRCTRYQLAVVPRGNAPLGFQWTQRPATIRSFHASSSCA